MENYKSQKPTETGLKCNIKCTKIVIVLLRHSNTIKSKNELILWKLKIKRHKTLADPDIRLGNTSCGVSRHSDRGNFAMFPIISHLFLYWRGQQSNTKLDWGHGRICSSLWMRHWHELNVTIRLLCAHNKHSVHWVQNLITAVLHPKAYKLYVSLKIIMNKRQPIYVNGQWGTFLSIFTCTFSS